jgi:hypothetical protein
MDLSRIALGLSAEPQSVGASLSRLLAALEDEAVDERETAEGYIRELARLSINWMARADESSLREVHRQIEVAFAEFGPAHPANRYLPDAVWVASQVRGIALVISTYLRTDNLAKSLAVLAGRRRESWRKAVETMGELRRPVTTGDLVEAGVFENPRTAANALAQLGAHGLIENVGTGTGIYALTWSGENAARMLAIDLADRDVDDNELVPAATPSGETADTWAGKDRILGLMQEMIRAVTEAAQAALAHSRPAAGVTPTPRGRTDSGGGSMRPSSSPKLAKLKLPGTHRFDPERQSLEELAAALQHERGLLQADFQPWLGIARSRN